jgi:SdrD B-like protein
MRALMVFGALVVTPFVAAVSQDRGAAATRAGDAGKCAVADSNRSTRSTETTRGTDPKARARTGCAPTAPAPTPPPPAPPPPADTAPTPPPPPPPPATITISGNIFNDILGRPGISGWTVEVSGPVTATAVTDVNGNYSFTGLPAGTYVVCEAIPMGWRQTSPPSGTSCSTGIGYTFTIVGGTGASFVNFGNMKLL